MQYTHSWINLPERACQIRINYLGGPLAPVSQTATTCKLTPGYYKNGIDLVNCVNTAIATEIFKTWQIERETYLSYDPVSNKVTIVRSEESGDSIRRRPNDPEMTYPTDSLELNTDHIIQIMIHPDLLLRLGFTQYVDAAYNPNAEYICDVITNLNTGEVGDMAVDLDATFKNI